MRYPPGLLYIESVICDICPNVGMLREAICFATSIAPLPDMKLDMLDVFRTGVRTMPGDDTAGEIVLIVDVILEVVVMPELRILLYDDPLRVQVIAGRSLLGGGGDDILITNCCV